MPIPLIPLIAGGAALAGNIFSSVSASKANKSTLAFQENMYNRQRADALADRDFENDYNSPEQQMARLKAAGLNPNLVYGSGSAANTSASVRSSSGGSYQARPVDYAGGVAGGISAFYDVKMKDAQLSNLEAQNAVIKQEAMLKAVQIMQGTESTRYTGIKADQAGFDLDMSATLRNNSLQVAEETLKSKQIGNAVALSQNEMAIATNASNLREAAERILSMRATRANTEAERNAITERIEGLKKDNTLKQLDIDLRKNGINPNDPIYMRILGRVLNEVDPNALKGAVKGMSSALKNLPGMSLPF